jgi:hypothetical protein
VREKGENGRANARRLRRSHQIAHHSLMAAVNTVKGANRQKSRLPLVNFSQVMDVNK